MKFDSIDGGEDVEHDNVDVMWISDIFVTQDEFLDETTSFKKVERLYS